MIINNKNNYNCSSCIISGYNSINNNDDDKKIMMMKK